MRVLLVGDEHLDDPLRAALERSEVELALAPSAEDVAMRLYSAADDAVLLPVRDLRRLLELERARRSVVQEACRSVFTALATALDAKDRCGQGHSQRVQRYAIELATAIRPELAADPSAQYGFLLHDVGTIGIPDSVMLNPGSLTREEWGVVRSHPIFGEQLLANVSLLHGEGLKVIRSHHERWDGRGYPDRLTGARIPLSARIFAVADALDAITSARPYRRVASWDAAEAKITSQAGRQFDPDVIAAFVERRDQLRAVAQANGNPGV